MVDSYEVIEQFIGRSLEVLLPRIGIIVRRRISIRLSLATALNLITMENARRIAGMKPGKH